MHDALGTQGHSCGWPQTKLLFMHCVFTANGVMNGTNLYEQNAGTKYICSCTVYSTSSNSAVVHALLQQLHSKFKHKGSISLLASLLCRLQLAPTFSKEACCMHHLISCEDGKMPQPRAAMQQRFNKNRLGRHCRSLSPHLSGILLCTPLLQHLGTQARPGLTLALLRASSASHLYLRMGIVACSKILKSHGGCLIMR